MKGELIIDNLNQTFCHIFYSYIDEDKMEEKFIVQMSLCYLLIHFFHSMGFASNSKGLISKHV